MYKINDLKRLQKTDLLKIANDSNLVGCQSMIKCQLIDKLVDAGLRTGVRPPDAANEYQLTEVELPVDLRTDFLFFQAMTDEKLVGVPSCSFLQLYTYICGDGDSTMKALDRAVKHASAGSGVELCHVGVNAVV
jgi:hypothetical protein